MPTSSVPRSRRPSSQFLRPTKIDAPTQVAEDKVPLLHLKRKVGNEWQYSSRLTSLYLDVLKEIATAGTTFAGKNALLTGVGRGSIGVEILKGLLAGGARVVVTTSRYSVRSIIFAFCLPLTTFIHVLMQAFDSVLLWNTISQSIKKSEAEALRLLSFLSTEALNRYKHIFICSPYARY